MRGFKLFSIVGILTLVLGCSGGNGGAAGNTGGNGGQGGSETGGGGSSKAGSDPSICTATSTSTSTSFCEVMKSCCRTVSSTMGEAKAVCDLSPASEQTEEQCLADVALLRSLGACGTGSTPDSFAVSAGVLCPLPTQSLITDFTPTGSSAGSFRFHFGDSTGFSGDVVVIGKGIESDTTDNSLRIKGTVDGFYWFGVEFSACDRLDASKYKGFSFKISGSVGESNFVTFEVDSLKDTIAASWLNAHGDYAREGASSRYDQSSCVVPTKSIAVTANPTVQRVLWSDFQNGKPEKLVTPSDILFFRWYFPIPEGIGTGSVKPYDVDIVFDDLMFIP